MITTSSKFFYGLAGVLLVAAVVYGYTTGGGSVGPISLGYKGAVGDLLGYTLLTSGGALALFVGLATNAFRDADPETAAEMVLAEAAPAPTVPAHTYWPIIGAFAMGLVLVGLVLNSVFFVIGLIALGAVAIEWTILAWSERATGDPAVNREIRHRLMAPIEVPLAGIAIVAIVVIGYSRVFLAVSAAVAVWAAFAVAGLTFGVATLLSRRPSIRKDVVAGVATLAIVVTLVVGLAAGLTGERDFHHLEHDDTHVVEDEGAPALEESN